MGQWVGVGGWENGPAQPVRADEVGEGVEGATRGKKGRQGGSGGPEEGLRLRLSATTPTPNSTPRTHAVGCLACSSSLIPPLKPKYAGMWWKGSWTSVSSTSSSRMGRLAEAAAWWAVPAPACMG